MGNEFAGCDDPTYNPSPVWKLSLLTQLSGFTTLQFLVSEKHCKGARSSMVLPMGSDEPIQLLTVGRLSVRRLQHLCKATVQSHKFWTTVNSWMILFQFSLLLLLLLFPLLLSLLIILLLFLFCLFVFVFFSFVCFLF